VVNLGVKADPIQDSIEIDGKHIGLAEQKIYIMLNKPRGCITSLRDPQGRPLVTDLIKKIPERVFPVGRLDFNTEGLLILTNDGDLAHVLQHPKHKIDRRYLVKVRGFPTKNILDKLKRGNQAGADKTCRTNIKILRKLAKNTWLDVTLWEGKNRQIKIMFEAVNHPVARIIRVGFGPLQLDRIPAGTYRSLTHQEIKKLLNLKTTLN
jgi:pseudouridine synthase